jgi:hypothetical protein
MTGVPAATFDALVTADIQTASGEGVTSVEFHVFAYLACLLSLYDGRKADWWTYAFVGTTVGAPFSTTLADAVELLTANGLVDRDERATRITTEGKDELAILSTFERNIPRVRYLRAACACALSVPIASLVEIIKREPQLRSSTGLMQSRALLDDTGLALLAPHFDALRAILGAREEEEGEGDLMIPGAVWLMYLASEPGRTRVA